MSQFMSTEILVRFLNSRGDQISRSNDSASTSENSLVIETEREVKTVRDTRRN